MVGRLSRVGARNACFGKECGFNPRRKLVTNGGGLYPSRLKGSYQGTASAVP
jgi:hypothetical protein